MSVFRVMPDITIDENTVVKRLDKCDGRSHANPCFDCDHAICGCEWSEKNKPVPGWNAELVFYGNIGITYHVIECPKFQRTPARRSMGGVMSDEEEKLFFKDPLEYIKLHTKVDQLPKKEKEKKLA